MALVFSANSRAQDARLREALGLAIDRRPILSVLLKGAGEPTAALLPNWMTGYGAAFPTQANVQRAKAVLADSRQPALILSYDPRDPQAQLIAERIALNAREAGITLQVSLSGVADVTLTRIALPSPDPATSLREAAHSLGLPQPLMHGNSVDDLYSAERSLLDAHTVIPLFHLPVASAAGVRARNWQPGRTGDWNLSNVWLEADSR
jgi:ABC-type transport system substrate-binding protein